MDVEATRAIRQAEVGASQTTLDRTEQRFGIRPDWLAADTAYGSAANLAWLVKKRAIIPFISVIDKSNRKDGTWSRADFEWDEENDQYICPEGHALKQFRRNYSDPNRGQNITGTRRYRALKEVCQACPSKHPMGPLSGLFQARTRMFPSGSSVRAYMARNWRPIWACLTRSRHILHRTCWNRRWPSIGPRFNHRNTFHVPM